jgi:hypothetical protein
MGKGYVVQKQNSNSGKKKAAFLANLKFFGMSLISNDTCVEARKKPWYAAVIIALLSTLIAMSPVMYNYFSTTGGSFLNSPVYNMDNALVDFDAALASNNLSCKIQDSKLTIDGSAWNAAFPATTALGQNNPSHAYVHEFKVKTTVYPSTSSSSASTSESVSSASTPTTPYVKETTVTDFAVYWAGSTALDDYYTNAVWGATNADFPLKDGKTTIFVLGESGFKAYKLTTSATTSALSSGSRIECKWNSPSIQGFDLAKLSTTSSHGKEYSSSSDSLATQTLASWKEIFADGYETTKNTSAWSMSGIFFAVYVGLALILGLTVFLMTRGKSNPFRIYTFWECQKIAYWASFAPALLGLIGFAFPAYAQLIYIFLFGLRVMWMSMRSLRPVYNN